MYQLSFLRGDLVKYLLISVCGLLLGVFLALTINKTNVLENKPIENRNSEIVKKEIIGFLPYWLVDKTSIEFEKYITTLTYFGLTLDGEAKIKKFDRPGEKEPGFYALESGKISDEFNFVKNSGKKLSLLVFCADGKDIASILNNPAQSAENLINEIEPMMVQFGFSDLNVDIEDLTDESAASRDSFTEFIRIVAGKLSEKNITLTVEASPTEMIRNRLIDVEEISRYADHIVVMGYDYHYAGSVVTGPVGPLGGAHVNAEYDVQTAVQLMQKIMPNGKIILGIPLYGYEWETLGESPRMAVVPGSGKVASDRRIEQILRDCTMCNLHWDSEAMESYLIFKDDESEIWHQIFYPDIRAMKAKVEFSKMNMLGGVALWALGYEDSTVLTPLLGYF